MEPLPRVVREDLAGHKCERCSSVLDPWQGQPGPKTYGFSAREIAQALARVAGGETYRAVAKRMRTTTGRPLPKSARLAVAAAQPLPAAVRNGQMVADWADVFTPVLWGHYAPKEWPRQVAMDETTFRYQYEPVPARWTRITTRIASEAVWAAVNPGVPPPARLNPRAVHKSGTAFVALVAVGYIKNEPKVVAVLAHPNKGRAGWKEVCAALPGAPTLVVADQGQALAAARATWPGATVRECLWHLGNVLRGSYASKTLAGEDPDLDTLILNATRSEANWDALINAVHARRPKHRELAYDLRRMDKTVRPLLASGAASSPTSTGQVETFLRGLRNTLADRAHGFTNKHKTTTVLRLMAMRYNQWDDEDTWTRLIEDYLNRCPAKKAPRQRQHADHGKRSLGPDKSK